MSIKVQSLVISEISVSGITHYEGRRMAKFV